MLNLGIDYVNKINDVLGPLIPYRSKIALFDFPNHSNVGDSAIWLGEEYYLKKILNSDIIAVDDFGLISRIFPELSDNTIVLIHGGGNFGDLYLRHQALREKLIKHYVSHRIVQMPQSIHFQDKNKKDQCNKIINSHNDFHLLVRDRDSFCQAQDLHEGASYLCPDMALCLGARQRPVVPSYEIVCLLRTDKEKAIADLSCSGNSRTVLKADWLDEPDSWLKKFISTLDRIHTRYPRRAKSLFRFKRNFYHKLAEERLLRGEKLLSSGKVVITDRLHAHILCTLLGIPHVVLDNTYRKIGNFRNAWRTGTDICLSADSMESALVKADELLARFNL